MAELEIKSRLLTCSLVLSSGTLVRPAEMQKVKQARRNGPVLIHRALAGSEYLKYLAAEPLFSHTSDLFSSKDFCRGYAQFHELISWEAGRFISFCWIHFVCNVLKLSLISYFTFKTKNLRAGKQVAALRLVLCAVLTVLSR